MAAGLRAEAQTYAQDDATGYPARRATPQTPPPVSSGDELAPNQYAQPETQLSVSAPSTAPVSNPTWTGDIPSADVPAFIRNRIEQHRSFVQPFLINAVFPEISARLLNEGGYDSRTHDGQIGQLGYLSAYFIDLYVPFLTVQDSEPVSTNHYRVDLKAPVILGDQVVTLFLGANIPTSGSWIADGGYNALLSYAFGSVGFSIQLRGGFGYDQLVGETVAPRGTSALADVAASFPLGAHADLLLQADGRKLIGRPGGTLRLWPGFRFFPLQVHTLSVALGGQVWLDTFNASGQYVPNLGTASAGGFLELGYVFM
jgi:hypothetical protein